MASETDDPASKALKSKQKAATSNAVFKLKKKSLHLLSKIIRQPMNETTKKKLQRIKNLKRKNTEEIECSLGKLSKIYYF